LGGGEREVLDWLNEKHGIEGEMAWRLFAYANNAKRREVRRRAMITLIGSTLGVAGVVGYTVFQWKTGIYYFGWGR
jgi:hypothetical protein